VSNVLQYSTWGSQRTVRTWGSKVFLRVRRFHVYEAVIVTLDDTLRAPCCPYSSYRDQIFDPIDREFHFRSNRSKQDR